MSRQRLTTELWIEIAEQKHGKRYDYTNSVYKGSTTKIEIICRKHGSFMQWPSAHSRQGQGCPTCAALNQNKAVRKTDLLRHLERTPVEDMSAETFAWYIRKYAETKGVSIKSVLTRIIEVIKETHSNAS